MLISKMENNSRFISIQTHIILFNNLSELSECGDCNFGMFYAYIKGNHMYDRGKYIYLISMVWPDHRTKLDKKLNNLSCL